MKIIRDRENNIYSDKNKSLGNTFTIIENNQKFYYEFDIRGFEALIITDYLPYIEIAIDEFRKYNKYVSVFFTEDRSFYKAFDDLPTFKLPINIIQPSKPFVNEINLKNVSKYLENNEVYLPVNIINDEYVLLDGHTRLYAKNLENQKMVNVYIDDIEPEIEDLVYLLKEQNISTIKNVEILSNEDYNNIWTEFIKNIK